MAIRITQYWPTSGPSVFYETEAQPQLNYAQGRIIIDLPTQWIYMPRNGRIEIEVLDEPS